MKTRFKETASLILATILFLLPIRVVTLRAMSSTSQQVTNAQSDTPVTTQIAQDNKNDRKSPLEAGAVSAEYDQDGRVIVAHFPGMVTAYYKYGVNGKLIEARNNKGEVIKLEHNADGRLAKVKSSNGKSIRFAYDAGNSVIGILDATGKNLLEDNRKLLENNTALNAASEESPLLPIPQSIGVIAPRWDFGFDPPIYSRNCFSLLTNPFDYGDPYMPNYSSSYEQCILYGPIQTIGDYCSPENCAKREGRKCDNALSNCKRNALVSAGGLGLSCAQYLSWIGGVVCGGLALAALLEACYNNDAECRYNVPFECEGCR